MSEMEENVGCNISGFGLGSRKTKLSGVELKYYGVSKRNKINKIVLFFDYSNKVVFQDKENWCMKIRLEGTFFSG
jgi:hypothetical protein